MMIRKGGKKITEAESCVRMGLRMGWGGALRSFLC